MNIKNWYNGLAKVRDAMNEFSNIHSIIDGSTGLLNSDNLNAYSKAVSGLSEKQAMLALSTTTLNDAQKAQVLTEAGIIGSSQKISAAKASEILASTALSDKKKEELLTDIGLVDAEGVSVSMSKEAILTKLEESAVYKGLIPSKQKEVRTAIEQTFATGTETISREGLVAVMGQQLKMQLALIATNPITWILAGVAALAIFTKAYAKLTTSANEANEAVSNAIQTSQNNVKTVREQKDNVDKLAESYEKLSKGVNTATNENLTLSTDDYKEYLDTCNQIADMYPELVSGYDAQGNAILSLKGNVQGLTDAYKEAQQEAYKTAFVGVTDEDGKTTGGISDVEKQVSYATNGYDPGDNWWNRAKLTTNRKIEQLKELQDMSLEEIKQSGYKYSEALKDSGININDLLTATEDQLPEYKSKINNFTQKLIQTQEDAVSNAKSSLEGYMKGITDASGSALASGYDKLTEEQQNFATSLLSSLDLDTLQAFENSGDFEGAAKKWVDNLVSSVSNMSATAKNAYDKLQDSIANPDDLTNSGIENINNYLDTLSSELDISKDKLKEIFNLDDIFDTQTSFDNLVKQYLGEDTFNELSSGAKKAADSVDNLGSSAKEATGNTSGLVKNASALGDAFDTTNIDKTKDALDNLSTVKFMTPEDIKENSKQLDNLGDSAKKNSEKIVASVDDSGQKIQKNTEEVVGKVDTSHKQVASNIQQVYDEADKSVAQSMDNIKRRNQDVVDSIVNSDDMKHAKATISDLVESAKEYDKAMSEAGKKSQYSGISNIDNDYKNSQDKVNPWKQFGQEYLKAQQEAHKNDAVITQAEMDNMDKLGQKAKSVWNKYIDAQKEAHKNDAQITQAQIDNSNIVGDKLKSAWNKYIEAQGEAHKNDAATTQAEIDNVKAFGEKIKSEASSMKDTLQNDFDGSYISSVKDNFKKLGEAFNNNTSVKYVKDTAKDLLDANAAIQKANDKAKEMAVTNQSAGKLASTGINQVISAQEQLENTKKKNADAEKQRQVAQKQAVEAQKQINEALVKQNEAEQKESEKAARWEKDYQIEAELAAKKREKQVTSEEDAQKKLSDAYNTMTFSQKKMFVEAAEGSNSLVETYEKYNELLENNALNSLPFDIDDITTHITNLNTALSESASATGLTADSISNLVSMFSGLDGYDASTLFENTANGVKLNREELEKLNQAYADDKTKDAQDRLSLLTDKYNELTQEINNCSDTSQMANLYSQRDAVMDQINNVQQLISQYDGLTSAFNEWQNAQNETSPGANYDSIYSYIETANEMAADGKWGNPAFKKFIELMSGQDLSGATITEMKQAWDGLANQIGETGYKLGDFLTEDGTGVDNFVKMLDKLDDKYVQIGEDGENIINIDDMDDLAQKMGTDVSFVQVLLDKLSEYGYTINVDSSDLDLLTTNAEKANDTLKELFPDDEAFQYTFNFSATGDDLEKEIEKATELLNDDRFKNANGEFDVSIDGASEVQQIMVTLLSQKESLSEPTVMSIDLDKLSSTNKNVIDYLQQIQSTIDGYQIQLGSNMDTSEMEKKVGDSLDLIDKIPEDIQDKLGISNDKVKAAAKLLKQNIADGVKLDSDAVSTIETALQNISPEILASLGIDTDQVKKDANETAQAFEDALTSVLSRLTITVGEDGNIQFHVEPVEVPVTANTDDVESKLGQVGADGSALESDPFNVTVTGDNADALNKTQEAKDKGEDLNGSIWKTYVETHADDNPIVQLINKLSTWFTKIKNGLFSATVNTNTSGSTPSTGGNNNSSKKKNPSFKGGGGGHTFESNGTMNGFTGGTFLRGYKNGTDVAISNNQTALINEVGTEAVLRNGVLTEVPGGAQLIDLKRGDIIFNHLQLEQLKRNGYVTANGGHGQLIGGFASGTLNGVSGYYKGKGKGKRVTDNSNPLGGGSSSSSNSKSSGKSSSGNSTKSSSGSSTKSSTKSSTGSGSTDTSSDAEETKETLDWIETKISRVERLITNLGKTVSATYKSWSDRNNALSSELSQVNSEISIQQQAYNRYMQEANNVGLDAGYAQKVRDGKIDIETITDDDLKEKINLYKEYYEKALDCSDAILDLKDKLYDLAQTNFDNITKQFEEQLDVISHSVNMVEGYIDLAETRGYLASTDYYDNLIKLETQNIGTLKNEYDSLANTLTNMTNSGQIQKYSEAWYDLYGQICDVEEALQDATKALSEYEAKMRELKWSYFETQQNYITNFTDEMSWLNDLLEKQGKLIDENGNLTDRGTASMGLHAVGFNTYMSQADDYAKEIQKINEELAKDPFNTILKDKRQEYLKNQWDSIDAAYNEIDAAKSLMKEGYDAQIDALDKLIEKRKNAMSAERDLYNYQKSISDKVSTVSSYEKQVIAYQHDDSEEGRAKLQQAQKNLKDARTDLQETEWDQQISDIEQMMDTMRDDYSEFLSSRLEDLEFIMNEMLSSANENSESIKTTLTDATASVGTTLSETMNTVWTSGTGLNGIVTNYGTGFNNALTTTNAALASIETMIKSMVQEAQKKADEDAAKQAAAAKAVQTQTPTVNSNSNNNSNQNKSNNKNKSNGNFFIHKVDSYPKNRLNVNSSIVDFS